MSFRGVDGGRRTEGVGAWEREGVDQPSPSFAFVRWRCGLRSALCALAALLSLPCACACLSLPLSACLPACLTPGPAGGSK